MTKLIALHDNLKKGTQKTFVETNKEKSVMSFLITWPYKALQGHTPGKQVQGLASNIRSYFSQKAAGCCYSDTSGGKYKAG